MPIYEYKCKECESHFEKLQKSSDEPLKVCPQCSGGLEKQWSLSGFQFKGEGWYVTDYAAKKTDAKAEKSESTNSKSEKGESSEKKSTDESTAKTESASKKTSDSKSDSKKDSGKKD